MHSTYFFVYPAVWGAYVGRVDFSTSPFNLFSIYHFRNNIFFTSVPALRKTTTDHNRIPLAMIQTMKKLKSGYINGTRVMLGHLGDFLNTSAITDLSFLGSQEDGYPDREYTFSLL